MSTAPTPLTRPERPPFRGGPPIKTTFDGNDSDAPEPLIEYQLESAERLLLMIERVGLNAVSLETCIRLLKQRQKWFVEYLWGMRSLSDTVLPPIMGLEAADMFGVPDPLEIRIVRTLDRLGIEIERIESMLGPQILRREPDLAERLFVPQEDGPEDHQSADPDRAATEEEPAWNAVRVAWAKTVAEMGEASRSMDARLSRSRLISCKDGFVTVRLRSKSVYDWVVNSRKRAEGLQKCFQKHLGSSDAILMFTLDDSDCPFKEISEAFEPLPESDI